MHGVGLHLSVGLHGVFSVFMGFWWSGHIG